MTVPDDVPEPQPCGWPHPTKKRWNCNLEYGHTGDCMRVVPWKVAATWPGPGSQGATA